MGNEYNIKLNGYQISHLFKNIRKLEGAKGLLARKLRITTQTLDEYLKLGDEYINKFKDLISGIYDIDIDLLDETLEEKRFDYIDEFLAQEGLGYGSISDKNKNAYLVFCYNKKELLKEQEIWDYQKNIIDNITFSDNEAEDRKIKLLIEFKLIYDRAQMSIDEELLYLKGKYGKTSSKNVNIIIHDLERRNKEDFDVEKEKPQQPIMLNQINNFTQISVEQDKALGLLTDNEDIIDAEVE